jgi:hypothetical protein
LGIVILRFSVISIYKPHISASYISLIYQPHSPIKTCYVTYTLKNRSVLFLQVGEAALPLILGINYTVYLQKGKKKLDVNSIFGENCMILKNFSLEKQTCNSPC